MFRPVKVLIIQNRAPFHPDWGRLLSMDRAFRIVAIVPEYRKEDFSREDPDVVLLDGSKEEEREWLRALEREGRFPVLVLADSEGDISKGKMTEVLLRKDWTDREQLNQFATLLSIDLKLLSLKKAFPPPGKPEGTTIRGKTGSPFSRFSTGVIALGASMGGVEATMNLLQMLDPGRLPGIVIVQHMQVGFSGRYAEQLDRLTSFQAKEAEDGDSVMDGHILVARSGSQLALQKQGNRFRVHVYNGEKVNGFSPSVDVLFSSAARYAGPEVTGVILTGIGHDGARGLLAMHDKGCRTFGQDEKSCVVYGMPAAARKLGGC